jgi:pyridoxamine 5'-phosphate oxidase
LRRTILGIVPAANPIRELERWIEEARAEEIPQPASVAFVTVGKGGRPSARTVTLKRIEDDALLFHWPALGRQVHITGAATLAERAVAEELFAQRDLFHQLQTVVSRQGQEIDDLDELRNRLAHLAEVQETAPVCPDDWGALRIRPETIELWSEADDRIHERRLYKREGPGWELTLLAP